MVEIWLTCKTCPSVKFKVSDKINTYNEQLYCHISKLVVDDFSVADADIWRSIHGADFILLFILACDKIKQINSSFDMLNLNVFYPNM